MRRRNYARDLWHTVGGGVDGVITVEEMRQRAKLRLPRAVFDGIEGGAGDERTIAANRAAFDRVWLTAAGPCRRHQPRSLVDGPGRQGVHATALGPVRILANV